MPMVRVQLVLKDSVSFFGDGMQFMAPAVDAVNYWETNNVRKYIFVQALIIIE